MWQLKVIVSERLVFSLIDSTHSKPIWEVVASTMIMWSCSQNPRMSQYSNQGQRIKIYLVRYNNLRWTVIMETKSSWNHLYHRTKIKTPSNEMVHKDLWVQHSYTTSQSRHIVDMKCLTKSPTQKEKSIIEELIPFSNTSKR